MSHEPSVDDLDAMELLAQRDDLTEWEEGFVENLSALVVWTDKQQEAFDQLWERKSKLPMKR